MTNEIRAMLGGTQREVYENLSPNKVRGVLSSKNQSYSNLFDLDNKAFEMKSPVVVHDSTPDAWDDAVAEDDDGEWY